MSKYKCPECGKKSELITYEVTAWYLNKFEVYCHSVKPHIDDCAEVKCLNCDWSGYLIDLKNNLEGKNE